MAQQDIHAAMQTDIMNKTDVHLSFGAIAPDLGLGRGDLTVTVCLANVPNQLLLLVACFAPILLHRTAALY